MRKTQTSAASARRGRASNRDSGEHTTSTAGRVPVRRGRRRCPGRPGRRHHRPSGQRDPGHRRGPPRIEAGTTGCASTADGHRLRAADGLSHRQALLPVPEPAREGLRARRTPRLSDIPTQSHAVHDAEEANLAPRRTQRNRGRGNAMAPSLAPRAWEGNAQLSPVCPRRNPGLRARVPGEGVHGPRASCPLCSNAVFRNRGVEPWQEKSH